LARTAGTTRTEKALAHWVDLARRAAWAIVLLSLASSVALIPYITTKLGINTDTTDALSPELPFRKAHAAYKAAFPGFSDQLVIVLEAQDGDTADTKAAQLVAKLREKPALIKRIFDPAGDPFFRRHGLLYLDTPALQDLSDRIAEAQPFITSLAADPSLRGLFDLLTQAATQSDKATLPAAMATSLDKVDAVIRARADGQAAVLAWSELLRGTTGSDARRRIIIVEPVVDRGSLKPAGAAMDAIRAAGQEIGLDGARLRITGDGALESEELDSVFDGAIHASVLSLGLVALIVVVGIRSLRLVAAIMATLIIGLIWTASFAAFAVGQLNLISVAFAVLFFGIAVDFGIHYGLRYKENRDNGLAHANALTAAATGVGPSLLLSASAVTLAFFSFFPTAYRGISELGLISGTGILIAFAANITLLPALITLMPPRPSARALHVPAAAGLESLVTRHARALCIGAIVIAIGALATLPRLHFDANPLNLKDPSTESVRTLHDLGGVGALTSSIVAANADRAAEMAERLKALPQVDKVVTVRDLVPRDPEAKLAIIDDMALFLAPLFSQTAPKPAPSDAQRRATIAAFQRAAASLTSNDPVPAAFKRMAASLDKFLAGPGRTDAGLVALENALIGSLPARLDDLRLALEAKPVTLAQLPADLRAMYLAADGRARVEVYPKESLDDPAALARFVASVRSVAPDAAGEPVMLLGAGDAVITAFKQASLTALVLTIILLWVQLRNVADVALVLVPLALASILTCAVSALFGPSLNFANIIVLPLLLGLGVATGIYLVTRAREESDGRFLQTITPRAVLFSALTTLASFGSLAVSGHRGTASMGILLTIALLLTLACMLVVLPAMRAWLRPARR
jgi:uncharacterized protein